MKNWRFAALSSLVLAACATTPQTPAPIVDKTQPGARTSTPPAPAATSRPAAPASTQDGKDGDWRPKTYTVKKGDTLYSIALEHGLDYREVAEWNQLPDVNLIKIDQILRLTPGDPATVPTQAAVVIKPVKPDSAISVTSVETPKPADSITITYPKAIKLPYSKEAEATLAAQAEGSIGVPKTPGKPEVKVETKPENKTEIKPEIKNTPVTPEAKPVINGATGDEEVSGWIWPTVGKLLSPFSETNKGIDLSGKMGQPVLAAAGGKVVYSGSGLRSYGKLIIIKHNRTYLSAYAHNSQLLVREGDNVKKGDKIAEMGNSDADQVKLHFEIRRFGKPVDPTKYLTAEKP
ncbi:peptidoglycan DD-metalloendopeptidase family protein [Parachitinimonas caeni]|uniref:Peptidoglycan DD-metalloendopeptidase family protein n=1 Tax=Parachitinimonas caeni TaxID=3031301 RepID=A0ABT7DX74_9NEIS|nr:peptidoglycan DD-metalloendopeptidase family protein [Parachitinimonas caeni]MDK2124665.1 peptidoglycan DD-metalloendopeptidase family protein [Parachitinimonas caeni]